ncbi:MAG: PQQ-binding-like beta-propeller repeat protein [Candidatus Binatia bacterium]
MFSNGVGRVFRRGSRKIKVTLALLGGATVLGSHAPAWAVSPHAAQVRGKKVYEQKCASCHSGNVPRAPQLNVLKTKSAQDILDSLLTGPMTFLGMSMGDAERRAVSEFIAGKPLGKEDLMAVATNFCPQAPGEFTIKENDSRWNGWGADMANTRFQPAKHAGLTAEQVPNLKLKWAFGYTTGTVASQPTVVGGRVFVGTMRGQVYSIDANTGCLYWAIKKPTGVRSAISVAPLPHTNPPKYAAYFGDLAATIHAVDAQTGADIWSTKVETHPIARVTGAPKAHDGRLYVPVTSLEEASAADSRYECCTFRGNLVALDAATGKQIWKTYTILEEPKPTRKNSSGVQQYGPAGASIWSSPTLDPEKGRIYVTTGDNYADPATKTSDAIIAFEMKTGKFLWSQQFLANDAWNVACDSEDEANCPEARGPDLDFGSSPILQKLSDGKRVLVAGQKSGMVYGIDPDAEGKRLWEQRAGKGGLAGGIQWGPAADSELMYVAVSDIGMIIKDDPEAGKIPALDSKVGGGIHAYRLGTGEKVWSVPPVSCGDRENCSPAQSAAISVIPGVVFSGSVDSHIRAYSTKDGKVIWDHNAAQEYKTVNGGKANGGSFDSSGPTIVNGVLYTNSGYGQFGGLPGNVLLAFSVDGQ